MTLTQELAQALRPCPFCGRSDSTHTTECYFTVDDEGGDLIAAWNKRYDDAETSRGSEGDAPKHILDLIDETIDIQCHRPAFKDELRAALSCYAVLLRKSAIPASSITVPREPTYDMLRAAVGNMSCRVLCKYRGQACMASDEKSIVDEDEARAIWKAMVGAAERGRG